MFVLLPDLMEALSSSFLCATLLPMSLAQLGPIMCRDTKVRAVGSYGEVWHTTVYIPSCNAVFTYVRTYVCMYVHRMYRQCGEVLLYSAL